jgi:2,3-dihydroxyphenylpropionate 1,2-dioxygenase
MTAAAVGLSHSPLIGKNDPAPDVLARVARAVNDTRAFVREFAPDLVVLYAPDHYNGFFYKEMPPFCLATEAHAVGDFGSAAGTLSVDAAAARALAQGALDRGIDLTISARMTVDHGFAQPLEVLFRGIDEVPVVPVFVNGVATPLGPVSRIRALGTNIATGVDQ